MFRKYHGVGNDFIICTYQNKDIDYSQMAKKVCDRHTGLGADGFLVAKVDKEFVEMIFYNADGSRAPMCGNGIRCFSKYCLDEGLVSGNEFYINTIPGLMKINVISFEPYVCKVNLGKPHFESSLLDIDTDKETFLNEEITYFDKEEKKIIADAVYMTTHHLVVLVDDLDKTVNSNLGDILCHHPLFKKGMNVNFVEVIDRDNIKMKTFERGVGWTLACGTGASSAYVILKMRKLCNDKINIHLEKGTLAITSINDEIIMEGPVVSIAKGIELIE